MEGVADRKYSLPFLGGCMLTHNSFLKACHPEPFDKLRINSAKDL